MPKNPCRRPSSLRVLCLVLTAVLLLSPSWAFAKGCIETLGGQPNQAPSALWGNALQPVGVIFDSTSYNGNQLANSRYPQATSVDIENGYLFASYWAGIGIWDLHTDPENPTKLSLVDGWGGGVFPFWPGAGETDQYVYSVDAPEGDDSVVAVGGISPVGLTIFNTSSKTAPVAVYQDFTGKEIQQVHAATIGGRAYAFAGGSGSGEAGLFIYDMTAAKSLHGCMENASLGQRNCPGVYVGKISTGSVQVQYVHGMQVGSRYFIVMSAGLSSAGHFVKIYDVTNPSAPIQVVSGFVGSGLANFTAGVAMWQQSGASYLAVRTASTLNLYDVTTCLTSGCAALPNPLGTSPAVARVSESDNWKSVVFSRNGSKPMLFLGNHDLCHIGEGSSHTEYVFDMSNVTTTGPVDISPAPTMTYPTTGTGELVNYWSYYYSDDLKGFAFTAPRGGKFYNASNGNSYLYRADLTLLDIHKWLGGANVAPTANFTWSPPSAYAGDPVTFTDTSTGIVTNRSWTFAGGNPSTSSAISPVVTFATDGSYAVSLTVSNSAVTGSSTANNNVTILKSIPLVGNVTFTPANPLVCQPVTLTANGVTGKPILTYGWNVTDANQATVGNTGTTNPFTWQTVGLAPNVPYHAKVTVHNGFGPDATATVDVTLQPLGVLAFTGPPTAGTFTAGTVPFHAQATAATEWNWDFGDGQGYRGWTGSYAVSDPVFTYTTIGPKIVKVKIRNCITAEIESLPLSVTILQIAPLVPSFQAECAFGLCGFSTGQSITFDDHSSGNPDGYFYDWNHNSLNPSTCSPSGNGSVQTTHTYAAEGTFFPCLRVTRGTESQIYVHPQITITSGGGGGGGGNPPAITVGGPSTGAINTPLTFAAAATNCTPSATWSWNLGGGTISGSTTGSQVTISWPIAGTKTVTATNLGCTGATGIKSVGITDGSGGGGGGAGGLTASFTFSPAAPNSGQAVAFDASSSVGSPTSYSWDFGDGQTANGATPTTSHTYQAAGNYTVKLDIGKPGASCSFGVCSAGVSKPITVGTGGPPPLVATFDTSAPCTSDFAGYRCDADVGAAVTFTATTANATSYSWSFGDGGTASGINATHTWTQPFTYTVQLTVSDGRSSASTSRSFILTGDRVVPKKAVILPWVAQTRGALGPDERPLPAQSDDDRHGRHPRLHPSWQHAGDQSAQGHQDHSAGCDALRRGCPAATVQPRRRGRLCDGDRRQGERGAGPHRLQHNGAERQDVWPDPLRPVLDQPPPVNAANAAGSVQVQNLIGLADNTNLLASVGISNPSQTNATYTMRLFDKLGNQIGTPHDFVVAQFGQRQYQPKDIQTLFGVTNQDDYRVEVRSTSTQIFPYSANLRGGTSDPSFVGGRSGAPEKVYLIGALSSPDALRHLWKSDVVLSNTASEVVLTDVSFIGTGVTAKPTAPVHVSLQPGETERMTDVIGSQWSLRNTVGVITLDSNAPGGVFPLVQGESYDSTIPAKRFGQFMPAMTEAQAAGANASHYLVGLRQDAKNRTVYWVFNPGTVPCVYDIVYRALDGHELGRISGLAMNPGNRPAVRAGAAQAPGRWGYGRLHGPGAGEER